MHTGERLLPASSPLPTPMCSSLPPLPASPPVFTILPPMSTPGFCYVNDIVLAILELLKYNQRCVGQQQGGAGVQAAARRRGAAPATTALLRSAARAAPAPSCSAACAAPSSVPVHRH